MRFSVLQAFQNALHPASLPSKLEVGKTGSQNTLNHFSSQGSLGGSQQSLNRTTQSYQSQGGGNEESDE